MHLVGLYAYSKMVHGAYRVKLSLYSCSFFSWQEFSSKYAVVTATAVDLRLQNVRNADG